MFSFIECLQAIVIIYSTELCGQEPSVVVGVVGLGHMNGIKENFHKSIDIQELLR